jgi:histidyl-tRNA synthetase
MSAPLRLLARGGQLQRYSGLNLRRLSSSPSSGQLLLLPALSNTLGSRRLTYNSPYSSSRKQLCTQTKADASAGTDRKAGSAQIGGSGSNGNSSNGSSPRGIIDVNPPRGTRDFLPEEKRLQNWLFSEFEAVSRSFGFEQIDFPVLESEELFVRKAGEEITEQLYNFEDKGGRRVTLRPELTPSLARLALQKGKGLALPAKWFAIGQCWRYERATRGRRREHYQWNMDIIGVPGVEAEAELLAAITTFFSRLGLSSDQVGIKVSSRKVLQQVLAACGVDDANFGPVCVIVDKMEKLPKEKIVEALGNVGLSSEAVDKILGALTIRDVAQLEALLGAENEAVSDLKKLFELAEAYGFADWLVFDASVVRGLAYYTGIVFEGFDRAGQLRAICGGGRYDKLLGTFGGEDQPCAGFGFGDAVIVELLKDNSLLPTLGHKVDDLIVVMDESLRTAACTAASKLRAAGRQVDLVLEGGKKMKWAFKQAERCGAARLVLFAPDEWERGQVRVKHLETREEEDVAFDSL